MGKQGQYNPVFKAGQDQTFGLRFRDENGNYLDVTGWTAKMQLRERVNGPVMLEISSENGKVTTDIPGKMLIFELSAADTADLPRNLVYDLFVTLPDESVKCFLEGTATIKPRVTR